MEAIIFTAVMCLIVYGVACSSGLLVAALAPPTNKHGSSNGK
jgi:hypothetical protein